jgi:hypothetical protein
MAVTEKEFESILLYGKQFQLGMQTECTYEHWKSVNKKSKKRTKPAGYLAEEWDAFWNQWPSMRSFKYKDQRFVCNKPFKKNEELLRDKYNKIIDGGEVTADQLLKAAKVFITSTMEDSYRKGRNEMEYVSGMEPWLNQKQWRNWLNVSLPEIQEFEEFNCG